jgi:phenylpropionate dioxygenase-like ring-hydroxylating dioxygenase large terminal subunit
VLFRDATGKVAALDNTCPHRGAPLSLGRVHGGRIYCAYHSWNFDRDGGGKCPSQPKLKCGTTGYQTAERLGYVWVAAKDAPAVLPAFVDEAERLTGRFAGYELAGTVKLPVRAPLKAVFDIYSEVEHVPYVHHALGWDVKSVDDSTQESEFFDDHTEFVVAGPQRGAPLGILSALQPFFLDPKDPMFLSVDYRFSPASVLVEHGWTDKRTKRPKLFSMLAGHVFVPDSEDHTTVVAFLYVKLINPLLRRFPQFGTRLARYSIVQELVLDLKMTELVADADLAKERLGAWDKVLIRNRRMLDRLYYGRVKRAEPDEPDADASATARAPARSSGG